MIEAISITEARQNFLPLLERIAAGAYRFMVTKYGKPVAVVVSYEDYERMVETLKLKEDHRFNRQVGQGLAEARAGKLVDIIEAGYE
jgi:antitoxin YefM